MVAIPTPAKLILIGVFAAGGLALAKWLGRVKRVTVDSALREAPWLSLVALVAAADAVAAWLLTLLARPYLVSHYRCARVFYMPVG